MPPCHANHHTSGTYAAWILGMLVVGVLIFFGCQCLHSSSSGSYGRSARVSKAVGNMSGSQHIVHNTNAPSEIAVVAVGEEDTTTTTTTTKHSEEAMVAVASGGGHFNQPPPAMSSGLPSSSSSSDDPNFMNVGEDGEQAQYFKPVDKKGVVRGATTRANSFMLSSTNGDNSSPPARTVGMNVLLFDQCRSKQKVPIGVCNVSFLDSDSRQVLYNQETNCWKSGSCPWEGCKA